MFKYVGGYSSTEIHTIILVIIEAPTVVCGALDQGMKTLLIASGGHASPSKWKRVCWSTIPTQRVHVLKYDSWYEAQQAITGMAFRPYHNHIWVMGPAGLCKDNMSAKIAR